MQVISPHRPTPRALCQEPWSYRRECLGGTLDASPTPNLRGVGLSAPGQSVATSEVVAAGQEVAFIQEVAEGQTPWWRRSQALWEPEGLRRSPTCNLHLGREFVKHKLQRGQLICVVAEDDDNVEVAVYRGLNNADCRGDIDALFLSTPRPVVLSHILQVPSDDMDPVALPGHGQDVVCTRSFGLEHRERSAAEDVDTHQFGVATPLVNDPPSDLRGSRTVAYLG